MKACTELPTYTCAVLVQGDKPVGYMAATLDPYIWSDMEAARELALYVHPEHRSYGAVRQPYGWLKTGLY